MKAGIIYSFVIAAISLTQFACDGGEKRSLINTSAAPAALPLPAAQAATNSSQPVVVAPQASGSSSGALNPQHGQPGHRCDIPVGSPLNQPAGNAATAATLPQQIIPNAQPITLPASTVSKAGGALNPKHGEPGHRCDIEVGAPLNSAPNTAGVPQPITLNQPAASQPAGTAVAPQLKLPQLSSGSGKLNPKHGDPGHNCAVAVGAPLP